MDYYVRGYSEYGKLKVKEGDMPGAWDLFYEEVKIGGYDGEIEFDPRNKSWIDSKINLRLLLQQKPLQRLYTWKSLLEDRTALFERDLHKMHSFKFFYNITILEHYFFRINDYIQMDVNSIDSDIEYEKKKNVFAKIPLHINPRIMKPKHYFYEELQEKINSLIAHFSEIERLETVSHQSCDQVLVEPETAVNILNEDLREVWLKNGFPILKNEKTLEYEIKRGKMALFIKRLYDENFICDDNKVTDGKDDVFADYIFDSIKCNCTLETIKREIRKCKFPFLKS